jgi:DNA-binding response OmpR family regulator
MKVLLVEDGSAMIELLSLLLQPKNASLIPARSDAECLEYVYSVKPDLIIIDRSESEANEWQLCRSIRALSKTPILVLSAVDNPLEVAAALDAGADHYLVKPVTSSMLLANIKTLVRRTRMAQGLPSIWQMN